MIQFKLKEIMDERGLSFRQVSAEAGVSTSTLHKMHKNKMSMVGVDVIDRLCEYFDIEPGDLIIRVPAQGSL